MTPVKNFNINDFGDDVLFDQFLTLTIEWATLAVAVIAGIWFEIQYSPAPWWADVIVGILASAIYLGTVRLAAEYGIFVTCIKEAGYKVVEGFGGSFKRGIYQRSNDPTFRWVGLWPLRKIRKLRFSVNESTKKGDPDTEETGVLKVVSSNILWLLSPIFGQGIFELGSLEKVRITLVIGVVVSPAEYTLENDPSNPGSEMLVGVRSDGPLIRFLTQSNHKVVGSYHTTLAYVLTAIQQIMQIMSYDEWLAYVHECHTSGKSIFSEIVEPGGPLNRSLAAKFGTNVVYISVNKISYEGLKTDLQLARQLAEINRERAEAARILASGLIKAKTDEATGDAEAIRIKGEAANAIELKHLENLKANGGEKAVVRAMTPNLTTVVGDDDKVVPTITLK